MKTLLVAALLALLAPSLVSQDKPRMQTYHVIIPKSRQNYDAIATFGTSREEAVRNAAILVADENEWKNYLNGLSQAGKNTGNNVSIRVLETNQ